MTTGMGSWAFAARAGGVRHGCGLFGVFLAPGDDVVEVVEVLGFGESVDTGSCKLDGIVHLFARWRGRLGLYSVMLRARPCARVTPLTHRHTGWAERARYRRRRRRVGDDVWLSEWINWALPTHTHTARSVCRVL